MSIMIHPLALDGSHRFWAAIHASIATHRMKVFSDNGVIYVAMSDKSRMLPTFGSNQHNIAQNSAGQVGINGEFYGLSATDSDSSAVKEGARIYNRKPTGGRSATQNYYIGNFWRGDTSYQFSQGKAPQKASASLGNCGPVIIDGIAYGAMTRIVPKFASFVGTRTFNNIQNNVRKPTQINLPTMLKRPPYIGKTLVAHNSLHNVLFVLILPHAAQGVRLPDVRDKLLDAKFDNAVYLDGSDSSLLRINGEFIVSDGSKSQNNMIGLNFEAAAAAA